MTLLLPPGTDILVLVLHAMGAVEARVCTDFLTDDAGDVKGDADGDEDFSIVLLFSRLKSIRL